MEVITSGHHQHQDILHLQQTQPTPFQKQFDVIGSHKIQDWTTPLTQSPSTTHHRRFHPHRHHHHLYSNGHHRTGDITTSNGPPPFTDQTLAIRLQTELREAKSRHLACTEVLLPAELLQHIAGEMLSMSEKEPCGIRGGCVYIEFEDEPGNSRRISSMQVDANTVSTFELYLTLKQTPSGWTSILPQFLKNLTRGSTVVISPDYVLTKNKLYSPFYE